MSNEKTLKLALPNVDIDTYGKERIAQLTPRHKTPYVLRGLGLTEHMYPLIERLALKRPEWQFVASYGSCSEEELPDGTRVLDIAVRDVKVYEKRELLGTIEQGSYSYRTKSHTYMIGNHRTIAELERANAFKTSDIDKAVKLVGKHFGVRNDKELYQEACRTARENIIQQSKSKEGTVRRMWHNQNEATFAFMLARWDEFLATIVDTREREVLSEVPNINDEAMLLNSMTKTGATYTVRQQGDYYLMTNKLGEFEKKTGDELPNIVRHKLGILKLVKDGQAVSDVGFKAAENIFLILKDNE